MKKKPKFTYHAICGVSFNIFQLAFPNLEDIYRLHAAVFLLLVSVLIYLCRLELYSRWAENNIVQLNGIISDKSDELDTIHKKHARLKKQYRRQEKHIEAYDDTSSIFIQLLSQSILNSSIEERIHIENILQIFINIKNEKLNQFDRKEITYEENSDN